MDYKQKYHIYTKSSCFLCLKRDIPAFDSEDDEKTSSYSIINLCRYLNFDVQLGSSNLVPLKELQCSGKETELMVYLCKDCCAVVDRFDSLFNELEVARLRINASVKTIYELMTCYTSNRDHLEGCGSTELMNAEVVEHVRKSILEKCSIKMKKSLPRIKMERLSSEEIQVKLDRKSKENDDIDTLNWTEDDNELPCDKDEADPLEIGIGTDVNSKQLSTKTKSRTKSSKRNKLLHPKCQVCGKVTSISGLTVHMRTHTGEKPHACRHCPLRFRSCMNLRTHLVIKHRNVIFSDCKKDSNGAMYSDEIYEAGISMLFQNQSRRSDGGFVCSYCGKQYNSRRRTDLECHMIQGHFTKLKAKLTENLRDGRVKISKPKAVVNEKIPKLFIKCNECGKVLRRKHLKEHMLRHTGEKPLNCEHCPERFYDLGYLRRHMFGKHRDVVFAACNDSSVNDEEFKHGINQLFENLKQECYTKDGYYPCNFCQRKPFANRVDAEAHMMEVHFDLLECRLKTLLGVEVKEKAHSTQHGVRLKNKGKKSCNKRRRLFNCVHCDKQYTNRYTQRVHMLTCHRFEVFAKHFPAGTTDDQVDSVIKKLLTDECKRVDKQSGFKCKFPNCILNFAVMNNLETHVLVSHFNEVILKLNDYIPKGMRQTQHSANEEFKTEAVDLGELIIKEEEES